ncbi:hypothetical protein CH333_06085 [candidate division WOR-3 bacterium JGI_Cruoil_03_44_89]|uniref:FlgD Ig-like domain-containing protein n=1 Tax=candidate division WOR-3 bacterium JGI_Cruoil_03_44_89 TaxID=1973748 RepID=A0A235BUM9_UNCW3|nr:MAG: hypothetical protein CH333_06085 [candidate division WOR-3 bacterium JGI_Cruoil_03_44_89]
MGDPDGATHIWALLSVGENIYAGADNYPTTGTGRVLCSTDGGHTWTAGGSLGSANYVHSLLGHSGIIYAGTDGKVYKSEDACTTWTQTGSLSGATSVNALAVRNDTIFAGTGPNGDVFKSVDYMSWSNTGELMGATIVWDLLVSFDGAIYAAGTKGGDPSFIFRSTDGGETWADLGFSYDRCCYSLVQASDSTIYAGTGIDSGDVYKTTDGETWIRTSPLGSGFSKASCVYDLIEADDGSIYAGTQAGMGAGIVFKSSNGGDNWSGTSLGNSRIYSLLQTENGFVYAGQDRVASNPISRTAYKSSGYLESSVYDTGIDSVHYGVIHWDADLHGCSLTVKVCADSDSLWYPHPEWHEVENDSTLPTVFDDMRYIQYRFDVSSPSSDSTPIIYEIQMGYSNNGTAVENDEQRNTYLYSPAPNPFISSTNIRYINGGESEFSIRVYDVCGRVTRELLKGRGGNGCITWRGEDDRGRRLPPGVYFIRLNTKETIVSRKVIILGR